MTARGDAGFTLLEVLVALAILSFAVVASIQGFAQGLRLLKLAGEHQEAVLIADEKAREIVTPKEGHDSGQAQRGTTTFTWDTETKVMETPPLVPASATATATAGPPTPWRMYRITVHVRWGNHRQVEIDTLRTVALTTEAMPAGSTSAGATATGMPFAPPSAVPGTARPGLR